MQNAVFLLTVSALKHSLHIYKQSHPRSGQIVSSPKCLNLRKLVRGHSKVVGFKQLPFMSAIKPSNGLFSCFHFHSIASEGANCSHYLPSPEGSYTTL